MPSLTARLTEIVEPVESAVMPQQVVAIIETADEVLKVESGGDGAGPPASMHKTDEGNLSVAVENSPTTEASGREARRRDIRETARPNISPKARRLAKAERALTGASING